MIFLVCTSPLAVSKTNSPGLECTFITREDVLRDIRVLELTKNNEQVIGEQLKATRERFNVGEVTKTDVSQAESRLARAVARRLHEREHRCVLAVCYFNGRHRLHQQARG